MFVVCYNRGIKIKQRSNTMNNNRKSHARKVYEAYRVIEDGKSLSGFGIKTRKEALQMYIEKKAEDRGMTVNEYMEFINNLPE